MYAGGLHSQCCNRALHTPGKGAANDSSDGHWEQDAAMFAKWKVDYLKSDPCGVKSRNGAIGRYNQKWLDAFTKIGYIDKLHFQGDLVCGYKPGASDRCLNATAAMANSWRTTGDMRNEFSYVMKNIQQNNGYHKFGGPGHWNDPDLLVVGNTGMTTEASITQMSLWCLTKAPLIISTDLRPGLSTSATNASIDILTNKAAIAVNQDSLGIPGSLIQRTEAGGQVWTGPLSGDRYAAVLVNTLNTTDILVQLDWGQLNGVDSLSRL
jgi:alpha-galactosidase